MKLHILTLAALLTSGCAVAEPTPVPPPGKHYGCPNMAACKSQDLGSCAYVGVMGLPAFFSTHPNYMTGTFKELTYFNLLKVVTNGDKGEGYCEYDKYDGFQHLTLRFPFFNLVTSSTTKGGWYSDFTCQAGGSGGGAGMTDACKLQEMV